MGLLRQVSVEAQTEEIQLEKARVAVVFEGDLASVNETLATLKNEHAKRTISETNPKGEAFSALVLVLPLYEGMPSQEITRTRKIKDDNGNDTGRTEEYLSAVKFADTSKIRLQGFEITPGRPVYTGIRFFETPAKSQTDGANGEPDGGDDDDDGNE